MVPLSPRKNFVLHHFIDLLNSQDSNILLTMELERNNSLLFVNKVITCLQNGGFGQSVYCKPTTLRILITLIKTF